MEKISSSKIINLNMISKSLKVIASAAVSAALVLSFTGSAFAFTAQEIAQLQAMGFITAAQAAALSGATPAASGFYFGKNLSQGMTNSDVKELQKFLNGHGFVVSASGVGSIGYEGMYFGGKTLAAVIAYQKSEGITPAIGNVFGVTRSHLNGPSVPSTPGVSGSVTVSLASAASSAVISGQAAADLGQYKFTNNTAFPVSVTAVSLTRGGFSTDDMLSNVYLYQGASRLTDSASVSAGSVTFNSGLGLFTIPANSSIVVAVKADIAASSTATAGSIINVSLVSAAANTTVIAGTYPISGGNATVVSATVVKPDLAYIGGITAATVGADTNVQVGQSNTVFWSTSLILDKATSYVKSVALKFVGSAQPSSIGNLSLFINGVKKSQSSISMNNVVTFDLGAGEKINGSAIVEVRGDVFSGSSRNFYFTLENASDFQVIDPDYNVVAPVTVAGSAFTSVYSNRWVINGTAGGSVVATLDTASPTGDIVSGVSNVTLAKYTLSTYGEDEKVSQIAVRIVHDAGVDAGLQNVRLYANNVLLGTKTYSADATTTYNTSLVLVAGQTTILEVKADLRNSNGTNVADASQIHAGVQFPTGAQGRESSQTITIAAPVEGSALTVVSGVLSITTNTSGFKTSVENNKSVRIGSVLLQNTTVQDVNVQSIKVVISGTATTTGGVTHLMIVPQGSPVEYGLPTAGSAGNLFQLSPSLVVAGNTSKIVDVYATFKDLGVNLTTTVNATYIVGNTSTTTTNVSTQSVSTGQGTLAVAKQTGAGVTASPVSQFVVGGTTAQNIVHFNAVATNADVTISKLYFTFVGGISKINGVAAVLGGTTSVPVSVNVTAGYAGVDVPVNVDYMTVGQNGTTSVQNTQLTLTKVDYTTGGVATSSVLSTNNASNVMVLVSAKPTLSIGGGQALASIGNNKTLATITVGSVGGQIKVNELAVTVATSGDAEVGTVLSLYDSNNASTPIATTTTVSGVFNLGTGPSAGYTVDGSGIFYVKANITAGSNASAGAIVTSVNDDSSLFVWTDVNGNATTTGAKIKDFPTDSFSLVF